MSRKLSEFRIARDLGNALSLRLVNSCIRELQSMQYSLLSGECSRLQSIWDDICVQQQLEYSTCWDTYLATVNCCIESRVDNLQPYELDSLWLLTPEGDDWDCELDDERESYPVFRFDVEVYLTNELLSKANDWTNKRIRAYLNLRYVY